MAKEPTNYPSDAADKYVLRFPDGMRDRLKLAAAASNRTLNAEIVARIERSFEAARKEVNAQTELVIERLTSRLDLLGLREEMISSRLEGNLFQITMLANEMYRVRTDPTVEEKDAKIDSLRSEIAVLEVTRNRLKKELDRCSTEKDGVERQLSELSGILKEAEDRITKQIDEAEKNKAQR